MCVINTNAQKRKIRYGIKAGGNISTIRGDYPDPKLKGGYQFGGFAKMKMDDKTSYQVELLYVNKGFSSDIQITSLDFRSPTVELNEIVNLNYIEIPIVVKYNLFGGLNVGIGPQIAYLVSANSDFKGRKVKFEDTYKKIDAGLHLKLDYEFNSGIIIDTSYTLGLVNLWKESNNNNKIYNNVFHVSLGYLF